MRDYRITVKPFEFYELSDLSITREVGEHGRAVISGYIHDNLEEGYTRMLLSDVWASIDAVTEEGDTETLLLGLVTSFSLDSNLHQKKLTLEIMGGTYLMDVKPHFRTFQNKDMEYTDLPSVIGEQYSEHNVIFTREAQCAVGDFVMQYQETDWSFMKRMASRLGMNLTPCFFLKGCKYYFDRDKQKLREPDASVSYKIVKEMDDYFYREATGEIEGLREWDCSAVVFDSREIYEMWDYINLHGMELYICKIDTSYTGHEFIHTYTLKTRRGTQIIRAYNGQQTGCSFEATVQAVKQDMVQVKVHGDENSGQETLKWFKYSTVYSTPDGTGWYCMPETGDTVRLHIPTKKEEDGYVISSIHLDVSSSDRKNPDHKSIMNKQRKEILFTPNSLILTNNNGMSIEILDEQGINIISDKQVNIQAAEDVTISSENSTMMIAGTESVTMKQGGTSVQLDDDLSFTGGEFRIQ